MFHIANSEAQITEYENDYECNNLPSTFGSFNGKPAENTSKFHFIDQRICIIAKGV